MGSHSMDNKLMINGEWQMVPEKNFQKANIYNKFSPFCEFFDQHSAKLFEEIRENLSRTIQSGELEPGLFTWSQKLKRYTLIYGFNFTKVDHLKLIHFYLSVLTIPDLNYRFVEICFDMLYGLLRKTRLITRNDLVIDWRILYHWAELIYNNHDKNASLVVPPKNLEISLIICVPRCSPYFSLTATQEILDEFRPRMHPAGWGFLQTVKLFEIFLPYNLPPDLSHQGFELWLTEFFTIWENFYNQTVWELCITNIFAPLAWNNIGYVNWEPWMAQIFTRILRGFSLPIGKMRVASQKYSYIESYSARWVVAMIGNGSSCLRYLSDLFISMKSFYHPSNTGKFQEKLVKFILRLTESFLNRLQLERTHRPAWSFAPRETHRLTEEDITDFVNSIKEYLFISIFNKDHAEDAAHACQYLSILRPQLIVPVIVEKHFSSIDSITEPHRFTAIMTCLKYIARQIVQQTPSYSHGQIYVLPLLMSVLPGIDLNDMKKTSVTFDFIDTILMVITCVDCSSAVNTRNDLTEIEKEVCLSTGQFEDFIAEFLNRIFQLIDILSADMSDAVELNIDAEILDKNIQSKLTSILFNIVQQCSNKIFQKIRERMMNFVSGVCLSPKIRDIVACLVRGLVKGNPIETLQSFLPKTCESIERILRNSDSSVLATDHKEDIELNWYLSLFAELVRARGDVLLNYQTIITSIFHQCIDIMNKKSYEAIANAATHLLQSLTEVYPIDHRLTVENIDLLPIRAWGQSVEFDKLQIQFHTPNDDEIEFACEFINRFLYPELSLLNEKGLKLSNNERLRSLTIIQSIAIGCFRMIPRIESEQIQDLVSSVVPSEKKSETLLPIYSKEPKLKENLRMRLLTDIGRLLDQLVENHSDDVLSITEALRFYPLISTYYGTFEEDIRSLGKDSLSREKLLKNRICGEGQEIRSSIIQRMELQIKSMEINHSGTMTDIDRQIILKLFELSINRYSQVRRISQEKLFSVLKSYRFSYHVIVDRIVEVLNSSAQSDHDQIKGCLHILLGENSYFLPLKSSWKMKEKIWPVIARMLHANKRSIPNLYGDINKKITKDFITDPVIQHTNQLSIDAAITLWRSLEPNEVKTREEYNQNDIQSYNNLMETLCSLLQNDTLTWTQQKATMSLLCLLLQRSVPIPSSCVKTFVDFLLHDNIELRQFATKAVAALCRLQKPPRISLEKSLEDIFHHMGKPIPPAIHQASCPGDRDDNIWVTLDDYKPPQTQIEWEETCFLDKSFHGYYIWPKMIKYTMNKRTRYTKENMTEEVAILYDRFIDQSFVARATQLMVFDEKKEDKDFNKTRFTMFKGLFRNFGLAFFDNFMEQMYALIHETIKEKQEGSHRVAAEIAAGMIRGSKHWTLEMLDLLWEKLKPFLTEVCNNLDSETLIYWNACFKHGLEDEDPRRMYRFIDFLRTLVNTKATSNTFNEAAHWSLIRNLNYFDWRIPSVWREIIEHAKLFLDHTSSDVRERVANLLAASFTYDVELFDGKSTRQPSTNQFVDGICEQLQQAIEIYEKTPLINISNQVAEIDTEAHRALNLIKTVIRMHTQFFAWSRQPIKRAIIHLFPYLCEIESIEVNDEAFTQNLTISRLNIGLSYLNTDFTEALIQQLSKICTSSKWHARRAAVEFIQNMIFCNLFNVRSHAQRLRALVIEKLFDEQYEVRVAASTTLSGFYQCGYIEVIDEDLDHFRVMSQTNYFTNIDGKKMTLAKDTVKRHGGVLGLCAIVLSSPYDIPSYVPDALMLLCEHSHDPDLIQKSIKTCLSEFRRTHHDSWHEHRERFTDDQLVILADIFISHSYYA